MPSLPPVPLLPAGLVSVVQGLTGEPQDVHTVMGRGGPGVTRWTGPKGAAVVKRASAIEAAFYRGLAPILRQRGLPVLTVYADLREPEEDWLVLEALPTLLPRERWGADASLLDYLAHLHTIRRCELSEPWAHVFPSKPLRPGRGEVQDAAALWPAPEAARLVDRLTAFPWPAVESRDLRLVSGDPNPTNWGLRADGTLVLFDWAEAGWGHPAYDLPIILPGLPSPPDLQQVVERYLERGPEPHTAHDVRAWTCIALAARLSTIVVFLANWSKGRTSEAARPSIALLQAQCLPWIDEVSAHLR